MTSILICWSVIAASATTIGLATLKALHGDRILEDTVDRVVIACWLGLGSAATFFLIVGVLGAVTPWVGAAFLLGSAGLYRVWNIPKATPVRTIYLACCGVIVLALAFHSATVNVDAYDTGLYHQQAVSWLSHFGVVQGIAWFNFRLGWSSSWFALAATVNHGIFSGRVAPILGGFITALSVLHWFSKADRLLNGQMRYEDWYLLFVYPILLAAAWRWHYDVSLGADLPTWIISTLVVWLAFFLRSRNDQPRILSLPFLLSAIGCSFKFSLLPLLPMTLLFALLAARDTRGRVAAVVTCSFCFVPVLVTMSANVITSGCPLYPSSIGCVMTEWSLPLSFTERVTKTTNEFARWSDTPSAASSGNSWVRSWVSRKDKLALLFLVITGTVFLLHRWHAERSWFLPWTLGVGFTGLALLFWGAPNPRFGLGFFLVLPATAVSILFQRTQFGMRQLREPGIIFLTAAFSASMLYIDVINRDVDVARGFAADFLVPEKMPEKEGEFIHVFNRKDDRWSELRTELKVNNNILFLEPVSSDQCWNLPPPCSPLIVDPEFRLRDPAQGLSAGFVRRSRFVRNQLNIEKITK